MSGAAGRSYHWLFWGLALLGLALDQSSKYLVFRWLYCEGRGGYYPLLGGSEPAERILGLQTAFTGQRDPGTDWLSPLRTWSGEVLPYVNTGALWGSGQNKNTLFLCISLGAAVALLYWSRRPDTRRDAVLSLALGLILAGTLGNLYDRIVFAGVRDFIQWSYLYLFPTFNIADSCLVCGATLLLWHALRQRPESSTPTSPAETSASAACSRTAPH
jgi:signal peptidase II